MGEFGLIAYVVICSGMFQSLIMLILIIEHGKDVNIPEQILLCIFGFPILLFFAGWKFGLMVVKAFDHLYKKIIPPKPPSDLDQILMGLYDKIEKIEKGVRKYYVNVITWDGYTIRVYYDKYDKTINDNFYKGRITNPKGKLYDWGSSYDKIRPPSHKVRKLYKKVIDPYFQQLEDQKQKKHEEYISEFLD